jgi:hypothetical protein
MSASPSRSRVIVTCHGLQQTSQSWTSVPQTSGSIEISIRSKHQGHCTSMVSFQ